MPDRGDGLTPDEITQLKLFLLLHKGDLELKGDKEKLATLDKLVEISPDIFDVVESKRSAQRMYTFVGSFAKWAGAIIGAIVAYKALILGNGSVKP